jgi:WD40 repeat protein
MSGAEVAVYGICDSLKCSRANVSHCKISRWNFPSFVSSLTSDRGQVAVGLGNGNIEIREINSGGRVRRWKGHDNAVSAIVFTSDGRLVSVSWDGFVKAWDVETGTEVWSRDAGIGHVLCVSELTNGRLVVGGGDMSVRVLDKVTGYEIMACGGHTEYVCAVISLGEVNAGSFASGSNDRTIRVWASDGTLVRVVEVVRTISFSLSLSLPVASLLRLGVAMGL